MASLANQPERAADQAGVWRGRLARAWSSLPLRAVVGALLIVGLLIVVRSDGWLQPSELLVYDALRVAWAGNAVSDRVVLIGASEEDIGEAEGTRWPWPLPDDKLADLLDRVASWKPRAIGVDIYRDIPIYRAATDAKEDPLDAVLRRHPEIFWVFRLKGDRKHPGILPPKVLRNAPRAVFADIPEDSDGVVRRALLYADQDDAGYTGLGAALALAYLEREHIQPASAGDDAMQLGKSVIRPLDDSRGPYVSVDSRGFQILFDYRGGLQPFHEERLSAVMDRNDLAPLFRDRLVIIGVDADSVKDSFSTPFSTGFNSAEPMNGIAMHAHLADQLIRAALDGGPMVDGLPRRYEYVWMLLWALGGALLGLRGRSTLRVLSGGAGGVGAIGAIVYAAFGRGLLLPAVPAALAWLGSGVLTNQLLYAATNRARARLRQSFEHYLSRAVIEKLVNADALPELGGENREISVLFTDVAGFTTFSEGRDPKELADITNQYFDGVCEAVFRHEGYVNVFIGDGVLAFFGAPQEQLDHADRAVSAALAIDRFAEQFRQEQNARGVNFGQTRIGVHTGTAFVGNVGARQRLQYTALGDILNTASRLEGLNKVIGSRLCVSREVTEKCRNHRFRPVGGFIVKGRRAATEVFAVVDDESERPEWLARYEAAFRAMAMQESEALLRFNELHDENPGDACVAFHYGRLRQGEVGALIEMQEK